MPSLLSSPLARIATVAFIVFALAGCREYVVDPGPLLPPAPGDEVAFITLKGPAEVSPGDFPQYRAQDAEGAVRYLFQITNPSQPVMQSVETIDRDLRAQVIGVGRVELKATAYDAQDRVIAQSARTIVSQAR